MTVTRAIGQACNRIILLIVHGLALSKIHPNMLTFIGLLINVYAAVLLLCFVANGYVCMKQTLWPDSLG